MREITYAQAVSEAIVLAMERQPEIFVLGEGVDDAAGIFNTTREAFLKFGSKRVEDTPLSENALTGVVLGAAVMGMHPMLVYARDDFMLLAMDQIVNHAAKWSYTYGGRMSAPIILRAIIGRGWGQGPQHSQSLQSLFVHIPGLKVVMPVTPYDAKGLLLSSFKEKCPVIFIEHRWLHKEIGDVPTEYYTIPLGSAKIMRSGDDVTIVAISQMVLEAMKAAAILAEKGIKAEIIDLRSLKPWDKQTVLTSVTKTGHLVVADTGHLMCGLASEIAATVAEEAMSYLRAPIKRISLAESPSPTSYKLEEFFYPQAGQIVSAVWEVLGKNQTQMKEIQPTEEYVKKFDGSF
ncbi:MAG: transketolase C-terminal domain-containing protein [Patescibacteria group bacterium]